MSRSRKFKIKKNLINYNRIALRIKIAAHPTINIKKYNACN